MPSEAIGRIRLGRGRQTAIDRLAKEILAASPDLTPAQATAQARAELEGQNLGIEGLGAGGASRLPQELRQELESVGGGQEVGDDPAPPTSILSYEADSSEDAINVPPAPIGERRSIDIPPAPETAGRGDQVARILEVLGGVGAGIGERRSIGKANKLTAQRQALSNLVNTLRGSSTTGVSPEQAKPGLLSILGGGLQSGAKAFREGRGLGREERNLAARKEFEDERLLREDERSQAHREKLAGFREREVSIKESTAAAKRPPPDARAPTTKVFPDGSLREWRPPQEAWVVIGEAQAEDDPPPASAPQTRLFPDGSLREWRGDEGWVPIAEKPEEKGRLSNQAKIAIADLKGVEEAMRRVQEQWKTATVRGKTATLARFIGIDFDPEGGFGDRIARLLDPDSAKLADELTANKLRIAAMLNRGRPSERDLDVAGRLLPAITDSDVLADNKFQALREILDFQALAIETSFVGNWSDLVNFDGAGNPLVNEQAIQERMASGTRAEQFEAGEEGRDTGLVNVDVEFN